jgi:predicted PurR-regulated permease PerM
LNEHPGDRLVILQRQLIVLVLGLIAILLVYQVSGYFSDILRIFGISILFSYLFIGLVDWLQKYLHSRALAVLVIYAIVVFGTIVGAVLIVPAIMAQVTQLLSTTYDQLPNCVDYLTKLVTPIEHRLNAAQIQVRAIDILNGVVSSIPHIDSGMIFSRMSDMALSTMTWTLYGLSILVVSFYFMLDGYRMKNAIIRLFPKKHEEILYGMASEIDKSLQSFFRGQIVLGLGFGAFMVPVFTLLGMHYALLLGVVLGILEIIPVIGSTIGLVPAIVAVAIDGMDNVPFNRFTQVIILFLVFQGLQWLKDNIVAPRYMGNVIGLHPVMIFLAIMLGARVDGMLGIIFAIPVACVVNVLATQLHREHASETAAQALASSTTIVVEPVSSAIASEIVEKTPAERPSNPTEQIVNPAS